MDIDWSLSFDKCEEKSQGSEVVTYRGRLYITILDFTVQANQSVDGDQLFCLLSLTGDIKQISEIYETPGSPKHCKSEVR